MQVCGGSTTMASAALRGVICAAFSKTITIRASHLHVKLY
jgi:hypothetical protein